MVTISFFKEMIGCTNFSYSLLNLVKLSPVLWNRIKLKIPKYKYMHVYPLTRDYFYT